MEPKEYQQRTLERVRTYLHHLYELKEVNDRAVASMGPDAGIDFPAKAWAKMEGLYHVYTSRRDGLDRPLPCFCLKVPTGGGKTFLAVKTIDLVNTHYLKRRTGLVLWVVPTTQIYRQTLKSLRDRDHPYRQHLDLASGGRTLIVEKGTGFSPSDVQANLVVLVLMLQSSARQSKDVLRVFKDNGGYCEFFPSEEAIEENRALLQRVPNLDTFEAAGGFWGRQIKTSLGNTLRLLNPVLILDEGHRAYSRTAQETLQGFNPSILVELTATPPKESNVLVDITGLELDREEMIKLDLHVTNKASVDWKDTLLASHNQLGVLQQRAEEYRANSGRYIRPICLIQVERTGREQRDGRHIHAEDVREHLTQVLGVASDEVAVKTSEKDELKEVDDVGGLMSEGCRIRYVITKQALQEGWDCAFAYVLCVLTNPRSTTGMTQLVGRILRQPYAQKTGMKELDESYVFCYQKRGSELLEDIRRGLMGEGLGDLAGRVLEEREPKGGGQSQQARVRDRFEPSIERMILPVFVMRDRAGWRPVSYSMDIASRVPWDQVDLGPLLRLTLSGIEEKDEEHVAGLSPDVHEVIRQKRVITLKEGSLRLDPVFLARHLADIVPNPWVAYDIGKRVLDRLVQGHGAKRVTNNFVFIIGELRRQLEAERDRLSEAVFRSLVRDGTLRFVVIANEIGFRLPKERVVRSVRTLTRQDGRPLQRSLFDFEPEEEFNELEKRVAWYLEEQDRLLWWYRNVPKRDYGIQAWRKHKIYADFIFTDKADEPAQYNRVYVVETKGLHLKEGADTDYKKRVFKECNRLARKTTRSQLGEELNTPTVYFHVLAEDEWESRLNELLA